MIPNFLQLKQGFGDFITLSHSVFLSYDVGSGESSLALESKRSDILDLVRRCEETSQFFALVRETANAFPVPDAIPDLHHYEVESFFRRSGYYLDLCGGRETSSVTLFQLFMEAFQRKTVQVRYLVPLGTVDFGLDSVAFGRFRLRRFSAAELRDVLALAANKIFHYWLDVNVDELTPYWFLDFTVDEDSLRIDEIVIPDAGTNLQKEFTSLPNPILRALQPLILYDWDSVARWTYPEGWARFDIPFVLEISNDLLSPPRWIPPVPSFPKEEVCTEGGDLTDVPFYRFDMSADQSLLFSQFIVEVDNILERLSNEWAFLRLALGFLNKAFFSGGLQGLLWHMTSLEAVLGEDREGLTSRLRKRLAFILGSTDGPKAVAKTFDELYDLRSKLVHGDQKLAEKEIDGGQLGNARQLARRTLLWFLHYADHVQRTFELSGDADQLPTRADLLAALDLPFESREKMKRLLEALPPEFPRLPASI